MSTVFGFDVWPAGGQTPDSLPCRLFRPTPCLEGQRYPLLVYFHGAGSWGSDNLAPLTLAKTFADETLQADHPCFIAAPQCPRERRWVDTPWTLSEHRQPPITPEMSRVLAIVDALLKACPIDRRRVYALGVSMGGFAVWDVLARRPDLFAAAVPICGGGDETTALLIRHIPLWAFHGALDSVVRVTRSRNMIRALERAGGRPRFTEYPETGHDAWTPAFREPGLFDWLFRQARPELPPRTEAP